MRSERARRRGRWHQQAPSQLALDDQFVYWLSSGTEEANFENGTLERAAHDGSEPTELATDLVSAIDLTVTDDAVFWMSHGTNANSGTDGAVFRLDK